MTATHAFQFYKDALDGAELWRWELAQVSDPPVPAEGDGVRCRQIASRDIDTIGLGARESWLFRCDGIEMGPDHAAPPTSMLVRGCAA